MGKSFVYNSGESIVEEGDFELTFGVFIDGTLNNRRNTELRRHYRNQDVENLTDEKIKEAVERDEDAYDALKNKKITEDTSEYDRYLIASHRGHFNPLTLNFSFDKIGTDNSFSNDFTNVVRLWQCCNTDYKIYVEGMGTEENQRDSQDGFAFGSGRTGIRSRVRKGCEDLAAKIIKKKKESGKNLTKLTIDVFGFSRGAASARNFVYEIKVKPSYPPKDVEIFDGYYPQVPGHATMPVKKYKTVEGDSDGIICDNSVLVNGMFPRMGHLGYCLLKSGEISPEELDGISLSIRVLGIYDTVSSYYERNERIGVYNDNLEIEDDSSIPKLIKQSMSSQFENNVGPLHLNDFGSPQKVIHFTAKDEHRVNFDLTKVKNANSSDRVIEKSLPGVHCDIGGAYENETEIKLKLETSKYLPFKKLKNFREQLINEYWFNDDQIDIDGKFLNFVTVGGTDREINTSRYLKKEYSYIPLHYMEEFCRMTTMEEFIIKETTTDFSIENDDFLISVRTYLRGYVFDSEGEWEFKNDEQVELEKLERELKRSQYVSKPLEDYLENFEEQEPVAGTTTLEEVVVYPIDSQKVLRQLRNEYLHWSAHRKWFGMEPRENRIRKTHI